MQEQSAFLCIVRSTVHKQTSMARGTRLHNTKCAMQQQEMAMEHAPARKKYGASGASGQGQYKYFEVWSVTTGSFPFPVASQAYPMCLDTSPRASCCRPFFPPHGWFSDWCVSLFVCKSSSVRCWADDRPH